MTYAPTVVICFGVSEANGVPSALRSEETRDALPHLGVTQLLEWPLSDRRATPDEVEAWMIGLRDPSGQDDWDLVYAPAIERGGHPQHSLVGRLAATTFADVTVEHYLTYTTPPVVRSRSKRPVPYDPSWLFRKHAALACYRSAADTPSYRHFAEDVAEYLA